MIVPKMTASAFCVSRDMVRKVNANRRHVQRVSQRKLLGSMQRRGDNYRVTERSGKVFLIVTTVLWAVGAVAGILPAMMSPMMFDAPGSEKNAATILLFSAVLSWPVVCLIAITGAWILFAVGWCKTARWLALLPLLNLIAGVLAFVWLDLFNAGLFS